MIAMRGTSHNISAPLCNALPSLCWSAFSLWLCSACILSHGFSLPFSKLTELNTFEVCEQVLCSPSVMLLIGVIGASGVILALMHTKAVWFFIVGSILAFVFSLFSLVLYAQSLHQLADVPWGATENYVVHVEKDAQTKGAQARTLVTLYNEDGTLVLPSGLKCVCDMPVLDALVLTQSSMTVKGTLRALKPNEYQRFISSHVVARLTVTHADTPRYRGLWAPLFMFREQLIDKLVKRQTPESALIAAITCGFRDSLARFDTYDVFKQSGLAHLIAVSGAHMSLLCGVVSSLLGKFHIAKRILCALMMSFMGAYLLISGFPISAVRAAAMSCLALGAYFAKRRSNALQALCICIIVFIACDTTCALSLSFALSALATSGILMFSRLFEWLLKCYLPLLKYSASILSVSLAALIPTQALSCAFFETLPLYSLCANILAAPFFMILCSGGSLALLIANFVPLVSDIMFTAVEACAFMLVAMLKVLNAAPFASIHVSVSVPVALGISIFLSGLIYGLWYIRTNPHAKRSMNRGSCTCLTKLFSHASHILRLGTLLSCARGGAQRSNERGERGERGAHGEHKERSERKECARWLRRIKAPKNRRFMLRIRIIGAVMCCIVCGAGAVHVFSVQPTIYRLTAFSYENRCCYLLTSQNDHVLINVTSNAAPLIDFLKRQNVKTLNYVMLADDDPAYYPALIDLYNAIPYQTLASFVEESDQEKPKKPRTNVVDAPSLQRKVKEISVDFSVLTLAPDVRDRTIDSRFAKLPNVSTRCNVIASINTRGASYQQLHYNDTLRCGNTELRVVWPHCVHEAYRNGDSLALAVRVVPQAKTEMPPAKEKVTRFLSEQTNTPPTHANDLEQGSASTLVPVREHISLIAPFLSFEEITDILLERNICNMDLACIAPGVCDDPFAAGELNARMYVFTPSLAFSDASVNKNTSAQSDSAGYHMAHVKELAVSFTKRGMRIEKTPP